MRHWMRYFIWVVICLGLLAAMPAQSVTLAPTPASTATTIASTATPAPAWWEYCLDGNLGTCIGQAKSAGTGFLILVIVIILIYLLSRLPMVQGWWEAYKKHSEKGGDRYFAKKDLDDANCLYLEYVRTTYRYFKFRGLPRVRAKGIEPPQLDQAYISLRMTYAVEREEDGTMPDKTGAEASGRITEARQAAEAIDLAEAMKQSSKLAIIGSAGSGKSTLLQWAALASAYAQLDSELLTDEQRNFVNSLKSRKTSPTRAGAAARLRRILQEEPM